MVQSLSPNCITICIEAYLNFFNALFHSFILQSYLSSRLQKKKSRNSVSYINEERPLQLSLMNLCNRRSWVSFLVSPRKKEGVDIILTASRTRWPNRTVLTIVCAQWTGPRLCASVISVLMLVCSRISEIAQKLGLMKLNFISPV